MMCVNVMTLLALSVDKDTEAIKTVVADTL